MSFLSQSASRHLLPRILISIIGLSLSGIGVGIFLFSQMGLDPASTFEKALGAKLGVSFGTAAAIINVVILLIVFFIDRKYISISSLLAIFFIGYVADGTSWVLGRLFTGELSLPVRLIFIVVGTAVIALGIGTYTTSGLGNSAIDLVSQLISDKLHWTYRWVRIGGDVLFVVIGLLLGARFGADVGLGTIIGALLLGPLVQALRPAIYRVTDRIPGCHHHS